jgi:hypothetical protein
VTYSKVVGTGTVTIPTGEDIYYIRINGDSSDTIGGPPGGFTVRVIFSGAEWNSETDAAPTDIHSNDAIYPNVMLVDRSAYGLGGPSVVPYDLRDPGSGGNQYQITFLSGGIMDIFFGQMVQDPWAIIIHF